MTQTHPQSWKTHTVGQTHEHIQRNQQTNHIHKMLQCVQQDKTNTGTQPKPSEETRQGKMRQGLKRRGVEEENMHHFISFSYTNPTTPPVYQRTQNHPPNTSRNHVG